MHRSTIWILVADGARARVVRSPRQVEPDAMHEPLDTILETVVEHRPLREIMSDAPGRTFSSVGDRRSAMEYRSDPVREEAKAFAKSVLDELDGCRAAGEFEELIICAPPRMLGTIREVMPEKLAPLVRAEEAKDFTKLPEIELRDALMDLVARSG